MATAARRRAQAKYNSKPSQVKRRASRNAARRALIKKGIVHKGDGKDVDHRSGNPLDNSASNLRVRSQHANRSLKRDSSARKIHRNGR
jgi:HNH endonuclease